VKRSTGYVSGVLKEFTDRADSTSTEEAAEEYGAAETVENLRSLAVTIKKGGTSVEELLKYSSIFEKIKQSVPPEKLEQFLRAWESICDKEHVEAALKMHEIEERTGKQHDEILKDLESKETRIKIVSQEVQRLNAEKTRMETEVQDKLAKHDLTVPKIDEISKIIEDLAAYDIGVSNLEQVRNVLNAVRESGGDPRKLVELAKTIESLRTEITTETTKLGTLEDKAERFSRRLENAKHVMRKYRVLTSTGWTDQTLESTIKLTKTAGKPEEVLCRLELLKSSIEAKADLDAIRAESEALKKEEIKTFKRIARRIGRVAKQSSILVNDRIPSIMTETEAFLKNQTNVLVSAYNSLVDKYSKLQADCDRLTADCTRYQKWLDDAVCWTMLLQTPEKLSVNAVKRIFFEVLLPQLEVRGKNMTLEERREIAQQMFLRAIVFNDEDSANLFRTPRETNEVDLIKAVVSFAMVIFPFYSSFEVSYSNKSSGEGRRLYDVHYHLDQFFNEGILGLSKR
jgi:hypothetical protein